VPKLAVDLKINLK